MNALRRDWHYDRLKDVATLRTTKTDIKSVEEDYLELEDIESWHMRILNRRNTLEVESDVTMFSAGDVLFGKLRPYLAKVCRPDFDGKCTGEILAIAPRKIDGGFLKYALIDPGMIDKCTEFSYGAKMPRINWSKQLSTFVIPLPPRSEQKRIAAFLDEKCANIDTAIALKRKQLSALDQIWENTLSSTTLHGVRNLPLVPTGSLIFSDLPAGWKVARLKKYFTYGKGLDITKEDLVDDGVPVISYGQIHAKDNSGNHLKPSMLRHIPLELTEGRIGAKLNKGDIVFADTSEDLAGVGNCVLNDCDDTVYGGYHTLIAKARFPAHSEYLSYLFQTGEWRSQLRKRSCGIKVYSLTQRLLSNVVIVLPPPDEQELIVNFLSERKASLDSIINNLKRQIDILELYRRGLIHEYVTGVRRCG